MEDIEQYSYAEDQNFSSSLPINNEEMIQKSEVKEEKEKLMLTMWGARTTHNQW